MRRPSTLFRPRAARAGASVVALSLALGALLGCSPASPPEPHAPSAQAEPAEVEPAEVEPGAPEASASSVSSAEAGAAAGSETASAESSGDPFAEPAAPPASAEASPGAASGGASARGNEPAAEGMISFFEIGRGDRVADLGGLFGYSLEPLLDAVGGAGAVYARLRPGLNPDAIPYAEPDRGRQGELIWMKTPITAPFTPEATRLNVVTLLYAYHSVIAAGQSRKALNDSVYRALVPGGKYIIVDHQAPPGSGIAAAASLHRIEDHIVRAEVEASGFRFVEAADFLINAARPPDRPAPSQYVLKFEKPR